MAQLSPGRPASASLISPGSVWRAPGARRSTRRPRLAASNYHIIFSVCARVYLFKRVFVCPATRLGQLRRRRLCAMQIGGAAKLAASRRRRANIVVVLLVRSSAPNGSCAPTSCARTDRPTDLHKFALFCSLLFSSVRFGSVRFVGASGSQSRSAANRLAFGWLAGAI